MQSSRLIALMRDQRTVVFVGFATFLFTLGQGIAILTVPLYGDDLGLTLAQIGFAGSAFAAARVFTNVPSAIISDRTGRRWVLIAGGLFAAAGNVLSASADSLLPLMAFRFIAGIGSGAFITVGIATMADLSSPANRARLMSVFQWSFIAGITLGPTIGGVVAEFWGIRTPFYVVGAVSTMSALWTLLMVPETRGLQQADEQATARPVARARADLLSGFRQFSFMLSRGYVLIILVFIGAFFIRGGGLFNLFPLIAKNDLGLSESGVGLMQTVPAVASLLVLPFVGALSDRYGRKSIIVPGMALYVLCLVVLGYNTPFWLLTAPMIFAIGMFLFGIAQGMEGPVPIAYVSDVSPADRQATAQGMARTLGDIALMSGGPILGFISDNIGSMEALYGTAVAMAIIMFVFWFFARETVVRRARAA